MQSKIGPKGTASTVSKSEWLAEDVTEKENVQLNLEISKTDKKPAVEEMSKVGQKSTYNEDLGEEAEYHKNYGKVPSYIKKYQKEFQDKTEAKMAQREKKKMPPGTRLMTEEERLVTLKELETNKEEAMKLLEKLPISLRTESLKMRKRELEEKIVTIEKSISTFSRKKVYIAE